MHGPVCNSVDDFMSLILMVCEQRGTQDLEAPFTLRTYCKQAWCIRTTLVVMFG
jgi:hypothetical protein